MKVVVSAAAQADLDRLFDFVLERELYREDGDPELAARALTAIKAGFETLRTSPYTCRKSGASPFRRELVIPFGRSGYVALFEIENERSVVVLAVRHQREEDYQ